MNGALGVAASLKTNRIGFEKYRMKTALDPAIAPVRILQDGSATATEE